MGKAENANCYMDFSHCKGNCCSSEMTNAVQDECSDETQNQHHQKDVNARRRSFWSPNFVTSLCGCSTISPITADGNSFGFNSSRKNMRCRMPPPPQFMWAATTVVVLLTLVLSSIITPVYSFNVDVPSVITHRGPSDSMFGFSVAHHKDSNISWILVGAPTAESVMQPGLRQAGAVYRCSCTAADSCQQLPFDRQGNNIVDGKQIDEKSNQWFGATVRSSGEDGIILACAPRYVWFSTNRKRRDPVGTCFVAKDSFTEFVEYSPCRTSRWGYHRQGSCQLGLGADIDSDGRRLFLGAVGSWYWQGQLYMVDSRKSTGERVPFYQFLPPGQVYSQSVGSRPDIRWTREGPSWDDDSYLGYSVSHGEFTGDRDSDVAVGMPRGSNLTGKVVIYSSDLINIQNITGDQIGAYFGYALAVLDIDGDGLDDLVIGAPMYTDFDDPAMKIETGRVYVLYQSTQHHFVKFEGIDGTAHKGRFGLALASCGDLNKDGFNDFAVGAPYDGLYGRGAVYIYHGSATGVRKEYTQVIYGEEMSSTVSTFGFSLSGGKDLDGNQYPDLIVGAYESDVVAYFRSKPVVRVKSRLSFPSNSNKQINLDDKGCTLRDRTTAVTCTQLSICMEYDGVGADDVIDFNCQYTLDAKKPKDPRMFFLNHEGRNVLNETVRLTKKKQVCSTQQVYLRPQIRDKLTSLEAELRYSMRESRYHERRELPPVIDITTSSVEKESISIQKNCGSDNICVPNLIVKVNQSSRSFLMGSTKRIWVEVEVANNGEDSYETMLYMTVPQGLSYVNFDRLDTSKDVPILCSAPTPSTNNTLRCDIGNPLPFHSKARLRVFFQPRYGSEIKSSYDFLIEANSTNPEDIHKRGDNVMPVAFPIRVETDTRVFGVSDPQPVRHNASLWKKFGEKNAESEIGPEVTHVYEVKCEGPSDIEEAEVRILWPSYTLDGQHFVYLLEQPLVDGPAECDHVDDVNPLALRLQKKSKWQSRRVEHHEEHHVVTTGGIDFDTEEELLRREQSGFSRSSSSSGTIRSGSSGFGTSSSVPVHGSVGISGENRGSSSTRTSSSSGESIIRTGDNVHEYGSATRHHGGGGYIGAAGTGSGSGYSSSGEGYYGGYAGAGAGSGSGQRHHQNSSSQHEYRREHSLGGGGSSGGYSRAYNYSRTYSSQTDYSRSSASGGGAIPDEYQDSYFSKRTKRATEDELEKEMSCGPTKCVRIRCHIKHFPRNSSVIFMLRGRIFSDTLVQEFHGESVNVSSKLLTWVTELPYNVDPRYLRYRKYEIDTTIEELQDLSVPAPIPWWVYFLAALAGVLLLLLIVYIFYKCGFFKRRRRPSGPEGQPLNRY